MSAILGILAANWQAIAGIGAAILAVLGLYAKGRSDEKTKAKLEDVTNANAIRRIGASARESVEAEARRGDVKADDGFRRD